VVNERARWGIDRFELGLALGGASRPGEWQRDLTLVERAETLGLHSVWVPEMHFARGVTASPLIALGAFAARTRRLRLATTSLLLPIHEPLRLADEIAALDRVSRGRTIIGLGRGFRAPLFRAFGVDPKTKRDRFDTALDAMLAAWRDGADGAVRAPWQRPHPPLAVAAFGPKGLAQAARRGLPYLPSPLEGPRRIAENMERWRAGLPRDDAVADRVVPVMRTVHAAASPREAADVLAALDAQERSMRGSGGRTPRSIAAATQEELRERVVVGTLPEVIDRLGALRDRLGIDLLIVRPQVPIGGADGTAHQESLQRLAEEAWPALR